MSRSKDDIVQAAASAAGRLGAALDGPVRRLVAAVAGAVLVWLVAAAVLPNGLPVGIVALGTVTGALTSFTALGLVLVYRSSRIINFAQAEIGGVAASIAVLLVANRGVNYFIAVPLGLAIALVSGAIIEITVVRRFFQAPRLILTVATIGLAQILGAATLFMPDLLPARNTVKGLSSTAKFTTPFSFSHEVFPVTFNGNHLLAVIAILAVLVGLVWLFNRTDTGIGVRGAADSQERAQLLGISTRRLSLITWVIAAGLSGLAGILSAGVTGYRTDAIAGPSALLAPLAAAVLARFEKLPTAFLASVAIGVFSQAVFWSYPRATTVDLSLFVLILVALLLQRRKAVRVAGEDLGSFVAAREARVVPRVVRALPEVGAARVLGAIALALIALGIPFLTSNAHTILFAFIAIYAIIGLSLVVLTGWAGQVSLGQFAFVGLGAATTGSLLVHTGWDLVFCLLASCACGAVAAIIIGVPALRVPGLFLAAVTLAFAVPTSTYFLNSQYFPTLTPLRVTSPILFDRFDLGEPRVLYYFCLSGLVIAMLLVRNFRRSRIGRAVIAARDNERLASAFSVATVRVKLIAFAVSGGLAGLAGGLYVLAIRGIPFGGFSPDLSVQLFTMVVVGGLTSITGAIVGALYVYFAQYFLTGAAQLLATGAGLLVILLIAPGGLAEILYRARDRVLRRVVSRREMDVPGFYDVRSGSREADQPTAPVDAGTAPAHDGSAELLTCARVCAAYGHLQVLFGVDLSVPDGSIVAMLGTNGAGKTTILKTIVGLLPPTGGRIIFDGVDVTQLDPIDRVRRGLVMVPAKAVFGSLTVRENLRLAGWIPRREGDHAYLETTTRRVFDLFPVLEERLDQQASLLSGGEQQMLALAQGLLARPRLLLVDELSLGLAPVAVSAIFRVVRELNKAGLPVVVVEQSINASASIAPDAVFIEKGEVRFSGPTEDLAAEGSLVRSVFFGEAGRDVPTRVRPTVRASVNGNSQRGATRPVFSARGITKTYGAVTAIADVDLDIYAGQILGIIGANGAGKTTAFDIFSGFTGPDHGTMLYDGADVTRASAAERAALGFGRTFQDVRLLPSLTTAETLAVSLERNVEVREPVACLLYFDATARSERSVRRRVDELLETFGLERYRDTFVADLSTGTRRVLELACAAGHRPNLLLLDEPSSGLSLAESDAMAQHLVELASSTGATLAIIEHDVPLVSRLSDELVCMDLGRIVARGKPAAVLADPVVIRSYLGGEEGTFGASVGGPIRKKEAPKAARAAKTTAVPTGRSR